MKTRRSQTEVSTRMVRNNNTFKVGLTGIGEFGESESWDGEVSRLRGSVYLLYILEIPALKWRLSANLRQEVADGYRVPFTPSFGAEGPLLPWMSAKVNISRNYRVPTFNELYFVPGGNPGLEPEKSWNEEASLIFKPLTGSEKISMKFTTTVYSSQVDNWVLWLPVSSWSEPRNIRQVWARGVEANLDGSLRFGQWYILLNAEYTWARSTTEQKALGGDASLNKQLAYIPEHKFFINIYLKYRNFSMGYNHRFTGKVYTTSDNLEFLPPYHVGDFNFAKSFTVGKSGFRLQATALNVWNEEYQVIEGYPNPGRSFKFTAYYEINYQ